MATPGSGISVNRNAVIIFAVLAAAAIILYSLRWRSEVKFEVASLFEKKEVDIFKLPEVPLVMEEELAKFEADRVTIPVEVDGKKLEIYSLQMKPKLSPPRNTVLLLHGMGDSSHVWVQFNTMHLLAHWGFRAVAVDLPGFGHSLEAKLDNAPKEDFMEGLTKALGLSRPIIVASSHGGAFGLPYLFKTPGIGVDRATALVAVACEASETYVQNYPNSQLRTLILYGDKDERIGAFSREKLERLPRSNIVVLPDTSHGALKQKPDLYHRVLYNYLTYVTGRD